MANVTKDSVDLHACWKDGEEFTWREFSFEIYKDALDKLPEHGHAFLAWVGTDQDQIRGYGIEVAADGLTRVYELVNCEPILRCTGVTPWSFSEFDAALHRAAEKTGDKRGYHRTSSPGSGV